jgi:hypothetical protein
MRFFLFLSTLLSVQSLVVDRPTLNPNVILHAVAQFGPQVIGDPKFKGSSPPVTGALVGVSPNGDFIYGCDATDIPTQKPEVWFLLAQRGNCEFASKAELAQKAGAIGVIVYDYNDLKEELVVMHQEDSADIMIPSIFITYDAGMDLLSLMEPKNLNSVLVTINATGCELNCGPWDNQWQNSVLWFLFIAFLAMWVVVLACFSTALCRRWCHRTARQRAVGNLRRRKFKKAVSTTTNSSPEGDTKDDDIEDAPGSGDPDSQFDQDSCVICLCEFENGDNLMVLPCGHEYHTECINPWLLKKSSKCPICKASCMPKPSTSTLEETPNTPLLDGVNEDTYDPEVGGRGENNNGEDEEDDPDDDDDDDDDDEITNVWNTRIFGLHPGALVLAGACCTGLGIAVAIMIFLFDG